MIFNTPARHLGFGTTSERQGITRCVEPMSHDGIDHIYAILAKQATDDNGTRRVG